MLIASTKESERKNEGEVCVIANIKGQVFCQFWTSCLFNSRITVEITTTGATTGSFVITKMYQIEPRTISSHHVNLKKTFQSNLEGSQLMHAAQP